jgi:hypothetical protein
MNEEMKGNYGECPEYKSVQGIGTCKILGECNVAKCPKFAGKVEGEGGSITEKMCEKIKELGGVEIDLKEPKGEVKKGCDFDKCSNADATQYKCNYEQGCSDYKPKGEVKEGEVDERIEVSKKAIWNLVDSLLQSSRDSAVKDFARELIVWCDKEAKLKETYEGDQKREVSAMVKQLESVIFEIRSLSGLEEVGKC